jgi:hypothetical protein
MDAPDAVTYDENGRLHWFGGAESFTGLSVGAMQTLIELGFLEPHGNQNGSPTTAEFLRFMKRFPGFTAIGYATHPDRKDSRVTIEGVEASGTILSAEAAAEFRELAATADECDLSADYARCWWD